MPLVWAQDPSIPFLLAGSGMPPALREAAAGAQGEWPVIYLSPRGRPFDQAMARRFSRADGLTMLCGRFEGVDQRLLRGTALGGVGARDDRDALFLLRLDGADRSNGGGTAVVGKDAFLRLTTKRRGKSRRADNYRRLRDS